MSEQDHLAILRREVKLKKALFSESQVSLYISSSTISLPNKFKKICGPKGNQSAIKQAKRSRAPAEEPLGDCVQAQKMSKRKIWFFALLDCEIIEAMWGQLIGSNGSELFEGRCHLLIL